MQNHNTKFEWATSPVTKKPLHISELQKEDRGAKGYKCIGCSQEMEACLGEIVRPYFRHSASNKELGKCVWSDEKTRRKLFHEMLQIHKKIMVPALSLQPADPDGQARIIASSAYVEAAFIRLGLSVASTGQGIKIVKRSEKGAEDYSVIANPDVIFLDANNKPVLCIHDKGGINQSQLDQLRARYMFPGISALYIKIPAVSHPSELEGLIHSTSFKSWIYNTHERQPIQNSGKSGGNSRTSSGHNKGFFHEEESYECRIFQINESIRGIRRLMAGADFQELQRKEQESTDQLKRILHEENADLSEHQSRLGALEKEEGKRAFDSAEKRMEEIKGIQQGTSESDGIILRHRELEKRYLRKAADLGSQIGNAISDADQLGRRIVETERRREKLRNIAREFGDLLSEERRAKEHREYFEQYQERIKGAIEEGERELRQIENSISESEEKTSRVRGIRNKLSNIQDEFIKKQYYK